MTTAATGELWGGMADRIVSAGRTLVMARGYNGFSYADIADAVGIRKASIHHHFPGKADLARAVIRQSRALIAGQMAAVALSDADALAQLDGYIGFWRRCIGDGTAPFCLAAVLAAELPSLPAEVAAEVRGHFDDLAAWLAAVLALGVRQGRFRLVDTPSAEADAVMATVYGAMLSARAFGDPDKFAAITGRLTQKLTDGAPLTPSSCRTEA